MGVFCKQFDEAVLEIVTDCRVFEPIELNAGKKHPEGVWVECALWDTGSTNTLISSRVVEDSPTKDHRKEIWILPNRKSAKCTFLFF